MIFFLVIKTTEDDEEEEEIELELESVQDEETPDVTMKDEEDQEKTEEKIEKEDEKINAEEEVEEDEQNCKHSIARIERNKLLLAMLQVFSKFTNVRSLYREPEVLKIYQDLLSSKNSEIQKAALACLYTYKYNYLLPYKVQLDNIVDEKSLKNELVRFQISVDGNENDKNEIVQEEHREGLIPVLMRILHAKMTQRVGMRTGGKAGGLIKRKIILRFVKKLEIFLTELIDL